MTLKLPSPVKRTSPKKLKSFKGVLISLTSVIGRPVVNQDRESIGQLVDLVFRWDSRENYPPLTGIIAKVAGQQVWIGAENIATLKPEKITLNTSKLDLRTFQPRPGEVRLAKEVLDHQLIDVDGARVVRASDLYLSTNGSQVRLVGLDVGYKALLRRLGPRGARVKPVPDVVIDWATIQSFGGEGTKHDLKLSSKRDDLRRMRPGELADLLEDLGRDERRELLSTLTPDQAADALEEMEPEELETILRESTPKDIAKYLSRMEPDEAADALRDVDPDLREDLLQHMSQNSVAQVEEVLSHDESTAGGFMTTYMLIAGTHETVEEVKGRIKTERQQLGSIDAVAVVNKKGEFVYDLPLVDLLLAKRSGTIDELVKLPAAVVAQADDSIKQVAEALVESRRPSLVVLDEDNKPIGRILADDIVDALLPDYGRFHFPRLWS